jgi:hypothetical protein
MPCCCVQSPTCYRAAGHMCVDDTHNATRNGTSNPIPMHDSQRVLTIPQHRPLALRYRLLITLLQMGQCTIPILCPSPVQLVPLYTSCSFVFLGVYSYVSVHGLHDFTMLRHVTAGLAWPKPRRAPLSQFGKPMEADFNSGGDVSTPHPHSDSSAIVDELRQCGVSVVRVWRKLNEKCQSRLHMRYSVVG